MTQVQLAARVGIERTTLLNLEAGRNAAVNRVIGIFGILGYDLVAVPRGARVSVQQDDAA